MEGVSYPLADMGLDVTVTIGADGTAEMNMNGDVEHRPCAMQDGALMAGTMVFTLQGRRALVSEDGADHDAEPREAGGRGRVHPGHRRERHA